jgi:hypothetical protein
MAAVDRLKERGANDASRSLVASRRRQAANYVLAINDALGHPKDRKATRPKVISLDIEIAARPLLADDPKQNPHRI